MLKCAGYVDLYDLLENRGEWCKLLYEKPRRGKYITILEDSWTKQILIYYKNNLLRERIGGPGHRYEAEHVTVGDLDVARDILLRDFWCTFKGGENEACRNKVIFKGLTQYLVPAEDEK